MSTARWTPRRTRLAWIAAVLALAAAVAALAYERAGAASPGIVPGYLEADGPSIYDPLSRVSVRLPQGRLEVTTAEPVTEVASVYLGGDLHDDGESRAGRGARIVTLAWALRRDGQPASVGLLPVPLPRLALVADGERYDLRATGPTGTRTVVVAGKAEDLDLEVVLDGVTQRVDLRRGEVTDAGAAAAYYESTQAPAVPAAACRLFTPRQERWLRTDGVGGSCSVGPVAAAPYVSGAGWAPDGSTWWVVPVEVSWDWGLETRAGGARYEHYWVGYRGPLTVTLDGKRPAHVFVSHRYSGAGGEAGQFVFASESRPRTVHVSAPFVAERNYPDRPGSRAIRFGPDQDIALR